MSILAKFNMVGFARGANNLRVGVHNSAKEAYLDEVSAFCQASATWFIYSGYERPAVDVGILGSSIVVNKPDDDSREIGPTAGHGIFVEKGRRAGAAYPPPGALLGWMNRHNFGGPEIVLARAISERGIAARPFMEPAAWQTQNQMDEGTISIGPNLETDMTQ